VTVYCCCFFDRDVHRLVIYMVCSAVLFCFVLCCLCDVTMQLIVVLSYDLV